MAKTIRLSYTVGDKLYEQQKLAYIAAENPSGVLYPNQIDNPADSGIPLDPDAETDPVIYSYLTNGALRLLLGDVRTDPLGSNSTCFYGAVAPLSSWGTLSSGVVLKDDQGVVLATNPYGIAQIDETIYIVDFDSTKIAILPSNALNTTPATDPPYIEVDVIDVSSVISPAKNSTLHGVAIIALENGGDDYLFALYVDSESIGENYHPSRLVRIKLCDNDEHVIDAISVGMNAVSIIPVTSGGTNPVTELLIPVIGGKQQAGVTNGNASNITAVQAFATWDDPDDAPGRILLQGDIPDPLLPSTWDIRAIGAAANAANDDEIYILTGCFDSLYAKFYWILYKTTVNTLLGAGGESLSDALASNYIRLVDSGYNEGFYWDILVESGGAVNRLWFLKGSPIFVTPSPLPSPAPGLYFDKNLVYPGGSMTGEPINVNSVDLTAETLNQAKLGVSLKRHLRGTPHPNVKAKRAAVRKSKPSDEEDKDYEK
jgi:hypothetical protein